jgi:hypothetical protein
MKLIFGRKVFGQISGNFSSKTSDQKCNATYLAIYVSPNTCGGLSGGFRLIYYFQEICRPFAVQNEDP